MSVFGKILSVFLLLIATAGCTTTPYNSAETGGELQMYPVSKEVADKILLSAIKEQFPEHKPLPIPGGYRVYVRFVLDDHNFVASMVPARGKLPSGEIVDGFYFKVSQYGTMLISGRVRAGNLLEKIIHRANQVSTSVPMLIAAH